MDEIRDLLGEEIGNEIEDLASLESGSEAKSKAVEDVAKLYRLRIEEIKAETEREDAQERAKLERMKRDDAILSEELQCKNQKIDRWINVGLQVGLMIGGWIAYDIWQRRGLKFEEDGVITSPWTRNLMSKMFPKK